MRRPATALVIAMVVFTGCASDNGEPEPTTAPETEAPTPTEAVTLVDVEVKDGEVVGGMERIRVPLGNTVRLSVRSDVADEVHVHGLEQGKKRVDIAAGGGIILTVEADAPGIYVVELEESGIHLVELEVR